MPTHPSDLSADQPFYAPRVKGYFLGKPLPWELMKKVVGLPGKACAVYVALWVLFSATRNREVRLKRKFFAGSGIANSAITRAIDTLIEAKLIDPIDRRPGKTPVLYIRKESEVGDA